MTMMKRRPSCLDAFRSTKRRMDHEESPGFQEGLILRGIHQAHISSRTLPEYSQSVEEAVMIVVTKMFRRHRSPPTSREESSTLTLPGARSSIMSIIPPYPERRSPYSLE